MRWQIRAILWSLAIVFGSFVGDQVVWTLRGSPVRQVEVRVLTAMELKNRKEDFGTAEVQPVPCAVALLPFPGAAAPCWWVERHREVIRRY